MDVTEQQWLEERRREVERYLQQEGVKHGRIAPEPAWAVLPCVSLWAIESRQRPGRMGWWVVAGDHPTDYVTHSPETDTPRRALEALGKRWREVSGFMLRGEPHPSMSIGSPQDWPELGELLRRRSDIFLEWPRMTSSGPTDSQRDEPRLRATRRSARPGRRRLRRQPRSFPLSG